MTVQYTNWTPDTKVQASKLWADGLSISQIATKLRTSSNALSRLMNRNRDLFPKRGGQGKSAFAVLDAQTRNGQSKWTDEQVRVAAEMWERGCSSREIGEAIDKSASAVDAKANACRDVFPYRKQWGLVSEPKAAIAKFIDRAGRQKEKRERHAQGLHAAPPPLPHHGYDTAVFALPGIQPVRLLDLTDKHCKWPITCEESPKGGETPFCGAARTHGSYCAAHAMISRGRGTMSEQNALNGIGGRKW